MTQEACSRHGDHLFLTSVNRVGGPSLAPLDLLCSQLVSYLASLNSISTNCYLIPQFTMSSRIIPFNC